MLNKLISLILIYLFSTNIVLADCVFSRDITKLEDGRYAYTRECHIQVGEMKYDLDIANQKLANLNKVIELKDLALTKSDERTKLWQEATYKLEDRVASIDERRSINQWVYFGIGVITTIGSGYIASKLIR
jgi:hypothetical protein